MPGLAPPSTLVPVRVDVTSRDRTIHIVDTIIIDPTCWTIPLYVPLVESVEKNIRHWAYTILSEAEVAGMGRTVRHFTGRVELWSAELFTKIEDQLRPQFWAIVNQYHQKLIKEQTQSKASDASDSTTKDSKLIPISIRLMVQGIQIQEDFTWDPSLPISPLEFAESLASDLNLPDEATVSILIAMLEQIYGLLIDPAPDETSTAGVRGAWKWDPKETTAFSSQIVTQHRPS